MTNLPRQINIAELPTRNGDCMVHISSKRTTERTDITLVYIKDNSSEYLKVNRRLVMLHRLSQRENQWRRVADSG